MINLDTCIHVIVNLEGKLVELHVIYWNGEYSVILYGQLQTYIYVMAAQKHVLNNVCTDNMGSCDMREHSHWLIVILGYKSVQIFYSVIIFKLNACTQVQCY